MTIFLVLRIGGTRLRSNVLGRIAAIGALCATSSAFLFGQQTKPTVVASPASLTFNLAGGVVPPQDVTLRLSNGQAAVPFLLSSTPGVTTTILEAPPLLPNTIRVTV